MRRVLVTGGAGFIGSNLVRRLLDIPLEEVVVLDTAVRSFPPNLPDDPRVRVVRGGVLDEQAMRSAFRERPDIVFHLAAHFANQKSLDHPETNLMVNGLGTLRVLEYSRLSGADMVVYASSGCAVSGGHAGPITEADISLHLDSPYQVTKMLGELYFNFYHRTYGLPTAICRYFNVYGPGELPGKYRNVIPNFVWRAIRGETLRVTGTGDETRDFTYVGDIVEGTILAATTGEALGGTFNLASGAETSVNELVAALADIVPREIFVERAPRRPWDRVSRRLADIGLARRVLGYEPRTAFADGVQATYRWMLDHEREITAWLG